jgi:hypothetical protein
MPPAGGEEPRPWPLDESDADGWPDASDCDKDGHSAELCKAKLEVRKKRTDQQIARKQAEHDAAIARRQAEADADLALEQEYFKAVLEVAKGAIERARGSADTVQKAAAAIVTLYTGVLALAFSVAEAPLPGKALFAAVLLGLAVVLSTAFLAYLPDPETQDARRAAAGPEEDLGERLTAMFTRWTGTAALQRSRALRASVVALAGGVVLMPAPFVTLGEKETPATDVEWPKPASAPKDPELRKILYTAQVAEAAEQRTAPIASDGPDKLWLGAFVIALVAVAVTFMGWVPRAHGDRPSAGRQ